jgi:hypothetical protein
VSRAKLEERRKHKYFYRERENPVREVATNGAKIKDNENIRSADASRALNHILDKIAFRTPRPLTKPQRRFLEATCHSVDPKDRLGHPIYGEHKHLKWLVTMVAPNHRGKEYLADHKDWVSNSVEPALNIPVASKSEAQAFNTLFDRCFVHNWHGKQRSTRYGHTTYTAGRKARRKFAWYADKPCKITGDLCFHIEGRHIGMASVRRLGIESNEDFSTFDFNAYWRRNLNLFEVDLERLGRWWRYRHTNRRRIPERISSWGEAFKINVDARTGEMLRRASVLPALKRLRKKDLHHLSEEEQEEWQEQERVLMLLGTQNVIDAYGRGPYLIRLDVSNLLPQPAHTPLWLYIRSQSTPITTLTPQQNPKIDPSNPQTAQISTKPNQTKAFSSFPNSNKTPTHLDLNTTPKPTPIPASVLQPKPSSFSITRPRLRLQKISLCPDSNSVSAFNPKTSLLSSLPP